MEVMVEFPHHVIDQLACVFLTLLGEVKIEHGGLQLGMAQVTLDDAQVNSSLKKMCGVGMTQRMNGDSLLTDGGSKLGVTKGTLDAAFGHGGLSLCGAFAVSTEGGKHQTRMAVSHPIAAQQLKGRLRQRNVAILGALTAVDMDHHALTIDIGDFEMKAFVKTQAAGVHGGKIGVVVEGFDMGQKASDFIDT